MKGKKHPKTRASIKRVRTGAKRELEVLGLDLSDLLWLWLVAYVPRDLFAIRHRFVYDDPLFSDWVLNFCQIAAPFQQRLQLVAARRHSFTLFQEVLRGAA